MQLNGTNVYIERIEPTQIHKRLTWFSFIHCRVAYAMNVFAIVFSNALMWQTILMIDIISNVKWQIRSIVVVVSQASKSYKHEYIRYTIFRWLWLQFDTNWMFESVDMENVHEICYSVFWPKCYVIIHWIARYMQMACNLYY